MTKCTLCALVENKPGVLARICNHFYRLNLGVESMVVGQSERAGALRLNLVLEGQFDVVGLLRRQLGRLTNVIDIQQLPDDDSESNRSTTLRVCANGENRVEVAQLANFFSCKTVGVDNSHITLELTGSAEKTDLMIGMFRPYGITVLNLASSVNAPPPFQNSLTRLPMEKKQGIHMPAAD